MDKEYKKFLQMELRRMPQPTPEEKRSVNVLRRSVVMCRVVCIGMSV